MPFPNQRVIPDGYAEHHRPTTEQTHTAPATIRRIADGPAPYPLPPGWTGAAPIWSGMARVQLLQRENNTSPDEQPTASREYIVTVPLAGLPDLRAGERGDVVDVIGRQLRITSIMFDSLEFERGLTCVDNLTQQNPD